MNRRTTALALGALALVGSSVSPARAIDDSKPAVACYGQYFTDKKGDQASEAPGAQGDARENLDFTGAFFKYDASKAEQASTLNIQIANLSKTIPNGATATSWYVATGAADGDQWVRALTDFTGVVSYEYGHFTIVGPQTQSLRDGATQGNFFEGPDGVIQLVLPADGLGKPGTTVKPLSFTAYEARQVLPGASPTPAKGGLLYEVDTAAGKGTHVVGAPCPAGGAPAAPAPSTTTTTTTPAPQPGASNTGPLPVTVSTKSVKAKSVKKSLKLKLKSSEAITQLGVQLVKGKKVFGTGKLASLNGAGTVTLKIKGKVKKGTYRLDLVGTDGKGARRLAAAALKVK